MKLISPTVVLAATALCLANPVLVHAANKKSAETKAIESISVPGDGQKKLEGMVGSFSVKIKTWSTPGATPIESMATSVNTWTLDKRYVQAMLSGYLLGEQFNGIGYMGFDNATKNYQATWMDSESTGMVWYTGKMNTSGNSAVMKATVTNPTTKKPSAVELHLSIESNGDHITEMWGHGFGTKKFKMMELHYSKITQ